MSAQDFFWARLVTTMAVATSIAFWMAAGPAPAASGSIFYDNEVSATQRSASMLGGGKDRKSNKGTSKSRSGSSRKASPPKRSSSAKPKASPPKRSSQPKRKASPPKRSSQPKRKVSPPKRSSQPKRKVSPPKRSSQPTRKASPPKRSSPPKRKASPPKRRIEQPPSRPKRRVAPPPTTNRPRSPVARPERTPRVDRRGSVRPNRAATPPRGVTDKRKLDRPITRITELRKSPRSYPKRNLPTTPAIERKRPDGGILDRPRRLPRVPWNPAPPTVIDRVIQERDSYHDYGDGYDDGYDGGYEHEYNDHHDYDYHHDGHYYDSHHYGWYGHYRHHRWHFRFNFWFGSRSWCDPFHSPWRHHLSIYHRPYHAAYYRPRYHSSYCRAYAGYGWYECYCRPPAYSYSSYSYAIYDDYPTYSFPEPVLPSIDDAWSHLRDGYFDAAQAMFLELVFALPYEGAPRIGYAISSGLLDRGSAAISAMRRVLRDRPEALRSVPSDPLMREQILILLGVYADRAREDFGDIDALFMVAALRFMLGEAANAYFAIDTAINNGDEDASAFNLKAMINRDLQEGL